jgi:prefoldin subunit 5
MKKKLLSIFAAGFFFASMNTSYTQVTNYIDLLQTIQRLPRTAEEELLARTAAAFETTRENITQLTTANDETKGRLLLSFPGTSQASKTAIINLMNLQREPSEAELKEMFSTFYPLLAKIFGVQVTTLTNLSQGATAAKYQQFFKESKLSSTTKTDLLEIVWPINNFYQSTLDHCLREITRAQAIITRAQQTIATAQNRFNTKKAEIMQNAVNALPSDSKARYEYLQYLVNGGAIEQIQSIINANATLAYNQWILNPAVAAAQIAEKKQEGNSAQTAFIEWFSPQGITGLDSSAQSVLQGEMRDSYNFLRWITNGGIPAEIESLKNQALSQRASILWGTFGDELQSEKHTLETAISTSNASIQDQTSYIEGLQQEMARAKVNIVELN